MGKLSASTLTWPCSMTLPKVLQRLDRLDKSSSKFPAEFTSLLDGEEYKSCIGGIKKGQTVWLIEYLDNVCSRTVFCLFTAEPA